MAHHNWERREEDIQDLRAAAGGDTYVREGSQSPSRGESSLMLFSPRPLVGREVLAFFWSKGGRIKVSGEDRSSAWRRGKKKGVRNLVKSREERKKKRGQSPNIPLGKEKSIFKGGKKTLLHDELRGPKEKVARWNDVASTGSHGEKRTTFATGKTNLTRRIGAPLGKLSPKKKRGGRGWTTGNRSRKSPPKQKMYNRGNSLSHYREKKKKTRGPHLDKEEQEERRSPTSRARKTSHGRRPTSRYQDFDQEEKERRENEIAAPTARPGEGGGRFFYPASQKAVTTEEKKLTSTNPVRRPGKGGKEESRSQRIGDG